MSTANASPARTNTAAPLVLSGASSRLKQAAAGLVDRALPGRRVRSAFRAQAKYCDAMGSPFMALLCGVAADRLDPRSELDAVLLRWPSHPGNDALALRFAGALHALVLDGRAPSLGAIYPPAGLPTADVLWTEVRKAMATESAFIRDWLKSPPQTNEVGRSAVLLGGLLTIAAKTGMPLFLSELGSSAGLNLMWDRYSYDLAGMRWGDADSPVRLAPTWTGKAPPKDARIEVAGRAGCDLNPLDASDAADRLRLLSYVWADQPERIARLRAALDEAATARPDITCADAADWLNERLAAQPDGTTHAIFHTIVWQYLPRPTRERIAASIARAGAAATADRPLAWLRLEPDGAEPGGAITLTSWPEGSTRTLGRADFHGRWVNWSG